MMVFVIFVLVLVFVIGIFVLMINKPGAFEGPGGHPNKYECFENKVANQMLAGGADPYVVRKFASALAAFDAYEWSHAPKAPVTVVGPVGDGWKKGLTMHVSDAVYNMLNTVLAFPHAVFIFGDQNFGGELYVLPIEMMTEPVVEFKRDGHRELINTYLKWLAPARILSAVVPPKRALIFHLTNGTEVIAKEGTHSALNITAPVERVVIKAI